MKGARCNVVEAAPFFVLHESAESIDVYIGVGIGKESKHANDACRSLQVDGCDTATQEPVRTETEEK